MMGKMINSKAIKFQTLLCHSIILFGRLTFAGGTATKLSLGDSLASILQQQPNALRKLQSTNTTAGDFDQINQVLAGATIRINETTINVGDGGTDGGFLSFIDLTLQLDATEQVMELLVDQVIEIPPDLFNIGQRRRDRWRQLQQTCPVEGVGGDGGGFLSGGTEGILNVIAADLELNFGDEINLLFEDFDASLEDQCLSPSTLGTIFDTGRKLVSEDRDRTVDDDTRTTDDDTKTNVDDTKATAHHSKTAVDDTKIMVNDTKTTVDDPMTTDNKQDEMSTALLFAGKVSSLLGETAMTSSIVDEAALVFGEELDDFLGTLEFTIPDVPIRQVVTVLGIDFNLDLNITDIRCFDFGVENLVVAASNNNEQDADCGLFDVDFANLDLNIAIAAENIVATCEGTILLGVGELSAQVTFTAMAKGETFALGLRYVGGAFFVTSCSASLLITSIDLSNVRILYVNLDEDVVNEIFDLVEITVAVTIENLINPAICDTIETALGGALGGNFVFILEEAATNAAQTALDSAEFCIENAMCDNLSINNGVDVTTSVKGNSLSAEIAINDFTASCSADVKITVSGIEITASVVAHVAAPSIELKVGFGPPLAVAECSAEISIEEIAVNDLLIGDTEIPEDLTDTTVDMIFFQLQEILDVCLSEAVCDLAEGGLTFRRRLQSHLVTSSDLKGGSLPEPLGLKDLGPRVASRRRLQIHHAPPIDLKGSSLPQPLGLKDLGPRVLQNIAASLSLKNGVCQDFTIDEVLVNTERLSDQTLGVEILVTTLTTVCSGNIEFDFSGIKGSVDFEAELSVDVLELDLYLISSDLNREFPSSGCVASCDAQLTVTTLTIDNLQVADGREEIYEVVLEALQEPVTELVETMGNDALCSTLADLVPGLLSGFLPPSSGNGTEGGSQELTIKNTVCNNLSLQSLDITSRKVSDQLVVVPFGLDGFTISCAGSIEFDIGSYSGTADFSLAAVANTFDVDVGFLSQNYTILPPNNATIESCMASITTQSSSLSNLVVPGLPEALSGALLGLVDGLIGTLIQTQGAEAICSALQESGGSLITPVVNTISDVLLPYLGPRDPVDPLSAENNYTAPDGILDLTTTERTPVDWFLNLLYSPFLDATFINDLVTGLLNDDGSFTVGADILGFADAIGFATDFADINVTVVDISIFGLNSFTDFGERTFYGMYTFGAPFRLEYIFTEVNLILDILPIGTDQIDFGEQEPIKEYIQLSFNATDVEGFISVFLAIVTEELALVPPTALQQEGGFECLLASIDQFEITQLQLQKAVTTPILSNFTSPGTALLANGIEEALWLKYNESATLAMPNIWQETLRPVLNSDVIAPGVESATGNVELCPAVSTPQQFQATDTDGTDGAGYGDAAGNANGFSSVGSGNSYGDATGNANGFSPTGSGDGYVGAADSVNVFSGSELNKFGQPLDNILAWDPLKRLELPPILPRASFFQDAKPKKLGE